MKRHIITLCVLFLLSACKDNTTTTVSPTVPVKIISAGGTYTLALEVAKTSAEQERGLMFRENLAPDSGMIFVYPASQKISMWMKNTPLSLDMIFVGNDRKISGIVTNTKPFSEKIIESEEPAVAVIELNAGTVKRLGLSIGDNIDAPVLSAYIE
jgi:uncharacterized membrane protein (UPF0127 family)